MVHILKKLGPSEEEMKIGSEEYGMGLSLIMTHLLLLLLLLIIIIIIINSINSINSIIATLWLGFGSVFSSSWYIAACILRTCTPTPSVGHAAHARLRLGGLSSSGVLVGQWLKCLLSIQKLSKVVVSILKQLDNYLISSFPA